MSKAICPDCKHAVDQHDDFFCSHVYCECNLSRSEAKALYEKEILQQKFDIAVGALEMIMNHTHLRADHQGPHYWAKDALAKIGEDNG